MIRATVAVVVLLGLAGCNANYGGPNALNASFGGPNAVSGMSPAAPNSSNSEPQPVSSLPAGAGGVGSHLVASPPNFASVTFTLPRL